MWPWSDSAGWCASIASRTAVEPTGLTARPASFKSMSAVSSGASSSPEWYGGQWKLKIVRSAGAVACAIAASRRSRSCGSSASR